MRKASFGSISSGTMRPEDLIPSFVEELRVLRGALPTDIYKLLRTYNEVPSDADVEGDLLEALFDELNEYAPAYGYFGSHEGDGADYGFWLSAGAMDYFDGLRVSDTGEVPSDYTGEVLHVNDHGNMTLYAAKRGKLHEVWSMV